MGHGSHRFFHRRVHIRAVTKEQIHIIELQAGQGCIEAFDNVFVGESAVVWTRTTPIEFCRNNQIGTLPLRILHNFAHDNFGLAIRIDFRVVEEVYSRIVGRMHAVGGDFVINLFAKGYPGTKRKSRDL